MWFNAEISNSCKTYFIAILVFGLLKIIFMVISTFRSCKYPFVILSDKSTFWNQCWLAILSSFFNLHSFDEDFHFLFLHLKYQLLHTYWNWKFAINYNYNKFYFKYLCMFIKYLNTLFKCDFLLYCPLEYSILTVKMLKIKMTVNTLKLLSLTVAS